jgi:hypothetical protein
MDERRRKMDRIGQLFTNVTIAAATTTAAAALSSR